MILAGAVNTAIIGSNGVLNRIAEDGVLPDWFLKPHPKFGTTYRLLYLIAGLQIGVILLSMGHILVLGEAYAFGVVWSFVFKALAMVVLRFKDKTPREYKVPFNFRIRRHQEIPFSLVLMILFLCCLPRRCSNFFTKEVATIGGIVFTLVFLTIFILSEHYHEKRRKGTRHAHLEQFNQATTAEVTAASLGLKKPYRKLVSIRSTQNLYMLEKALAETDPETTDMVVMTAKVTPDGRPSTLGPPPGPRRLRSNADDGRGRARGEGRQAGHAGHRADANSTLVRRAENGQGFECSRGDPRRLEQIHGGRAARTNRVYLDQLARRTSGAADGAHSEP